MNPAFDQLIEIMDEETTAYRQMQAVLSEEKHASMIRKKNQFQSIIQKKQVVVDKIKRLEERRQRQVEKLAQECGIDAEALPITTRQLAGHLSPAMARQLTDRATQLKQLIKSVQLENSAIAQHYAYCLELVHGALQMLNDLIYGHAIYARPGSGKQTSGYGGNRGKVFCGNI